MKLSMLTIREIVKKELVEQSKENGKWGRYKHGPKVGQVRTEPPTVDMHAVQAGEKKKAQRGSEEEFFGRGDPLLTRTQDLPELPSSAVRPVGITPDDESDEELAKLRSDPQAAERAQEPVTPPGGRTTASRPGVEGPDVTAPTPTSPSRYKESERLFRHFFGDYDDDALELLLHNEPDLEDIVKQLYGWQLPEYRRHFDAPGTDIVKIAQEFEKEEKSIIDNEEEFMERLQAYQFKSGKEEFEKIRITPEEEAEQWAIQKLVSQSNLPTPDSVRRDLIPQYIEYVKSKHGDEYQKLYDLALYNFKKFREEKNA